MSLRLTSDKAIPVQAHLYELSIRLGRLLAILVLMMIIYMVNILFLLNLQLFTLIVIYSSLLQKI